MENILNTGKRIGGFVADLFRTYFPYFLRKQLDLTRVLGD